MDVGRVCVGLHPPVLLGETANATRKSGKMPRVAVTAPQSSILAQAARVASHGGQSSQLRR
jgi:hypothetical protein